MTRTSPPQPHGADRPATPAGAATARTPPPRTAALLLVAAALSGLLAIGADFGGPSWWRWAFKPLTTALLLAWAWPRGGDQPATRRWILVGLAASWCGDVALLWPDRGFLPGLLSFLVAHLAYLVAFTRGVRLAAWPWPFVAYALVAAAVLSQLWEGVPGALRLPVAVYVTALAGMAAQAAVWSRHARRQPGYGAGQHLGNHASNPVAMRAAVGGALFMASDAVLAWNRFLEPVPAAGFWILATYWLAQAAIAASLRRRG